MLLYNKLSSFQFMDMRNLMMKILDKNGKEMHFIKRLVNSHNLMIEVRV